VISVFRAFRFRFGCETWFSFLVSITVAYSVALTIGLRVGFCCISKFSGQSLAMKLKFAFLLLVLAVMWCNFIFQLIFVISGFLVSVRICFVLWSTLLYLSGYVAFFAFGSVFSGVLCYLLGVPCWLFRAVSREMKFRISLCVCVETTRGVSSHAFSGLWGMKEFVWL
jgi:hypothetical protein